MIAWRGHRGIGWAGYCIDCGARPGANLSRECPTWRTRGVFA